MSIAAKNNLLKDLSLEFGKELTVVQTNRIMSILADQLSEYDIHEHEFQGECESDDYLSAFLQAKEIEGKSKKTIERYRYVINKMIAEIKRPIRKINIYHLRQYLMSGKDKGWSDRTLEGYRSIFSSFFNWLWREGLLENCPVANLSPIKCIKEIKLPYTDVDVEKLKEATENIRDKAIICFLLSTGCRIGEVIKLNREDIDFNKMECKVVGKGNKERIVYIDNITAMNLKKYFSSRTDALPALFIGKGSERMTSGGVRFMLKKLEKKAGVENVHPHRFRRTLATNLIARGMPIQDVACILGHDKLDTTMEYVYINKDDVKAKYKKYA